MNTNISLAIELAYVLTKWADAVFFPVYSSLEIFLNNVRANDVARYEIFTCTSVLFIIPFVRSSSVDRTVRKM